MATWTRELGKSGWRAHRGRCVRVALLASVLGLTSCTGGIEAPNAAPGGDVVVQPEVVRAESPIILRGEDGTPLRLREVAFRGQLDAFFGATEVEMTFENPEGRSLDGRLSVALPPDARLVRFAVFEGGAWREAEVVPRKAAFETLLRDVREPALVADGGGGDRLLARLPRIPHGELRVLVGYVEEIRGREQPYRIALAGLPRLDAIDVRVTGAELHGRGPGEARKLADGRSLYAFRGRGSVDQDIVIHSPGQRVGGLRHDNRVVARISPVPHDHAEPISSLTILFDTSASQALGFGAQIDRLARIVDEIRRWTAADIPLRVLCFDQGVETVFEGRISAFGERHLAAIRARGALGASDLVGALRFAGSQPSRRYERMIVFTDGVVTAGAGHVEALRNEVARLAEVGVKRVDAVALGQGRGELLAAISRSGLPRDGLVIRADAAPEIALRKLVHEVISGVEVKVTGSQWVYPERLDGIQADDTVLVYADLAAEEEAVEVVVGGSLRGRQAVTTVAATAPSILETAWRAGHVRWMEAQARACEGETCEAWRRRIVDASIRHRILNDATALIMPGRGIDAGRLAPLLAFGSEGVEVRQRGDQAVPGGAGSASAHVLVAEPVLPDIHRSDLSQVSQGAGRSRPTTPPGAPRPLPAGTPASRPGASAAMVADGRWPAADEEIPEKAQVGPRRRPKDAYDGLLLAVMDSLRLGDKPSAGSLARRWRDDEPASVLALIALGEALEANGRIDEAARAYGSIADLFPTRPEMRRLAAARLERLGDVTRWLVIDSYARALRKQPSDPSSHRLYGYALLRHALLSGDLSYYREAFDVLLSGFAWARADARSQAMARVLYEDIGLAAAAWIAARPDDRAYVLEALSVNGIALAEEPSLRFVLTWDTAISDVDLHVRDGDGRHAFYRQRSLESGGRLYADVTAGLGIEAFVIDGAAAGFPYSLQIDYDTLDPHLGYGMGKVEIIEHDGRGGLSFRELPFVVSRDGANLDLGVVEGPLAAARAPSLDEG